MNNGNNVLEGLSCSPDQRKLLINNNNINNINNNNNLNNNKNLNNNNRNGDIDAKNIDIKDDSLLRNQRFRFGSSKTLSRDDDRILKEMVSLITTKKPASEPKN